MRKKYLSALLFGALLFASAGTFTSCKDYDDDISNLQEQVDGVKADLEDLQAQISAGKWITNVAAIEGGFTVTFSDGQSFNIVNGQDGADGAAGAAGTPGTQITIGEDGYWYFDGEKSEYKAVSDEETAKVNVPYVNTEDGYWYFYNEEGEAVKSDYKAVGAAYAVAANGGYNLYMPDATGEMNEPIFLPGEGASITDIELVDLDGPDNEDTEEEENPISANALTIYKNKFTFNSKTSDIDAASKWGGTKALPANNSVVYSTSQLGLRINPVEIDGTDVEYTLVTSKNNTLSNVTLKATEYKELVNSRAFGNGLYTLKMDNVVLSETAAGALDDEIEEFKDKATFAVNADRSIRTDYSVQISSTDGADLSTINVKDAKFSAPTGVEKTEIGSNNTTYTVNVGQTYTVTVDEPSALYDMYFVVSDEVKNAYQVQFGENGAPTFTVGRNPDSSSLEAKFNVDVYTASNEGKIYKTTITISLSSQIPSTGQYAEITTNVKDKDNFTFDLATMKSGLGNLETWMLNVDLTKTDYALYKKYENDKLSEEVTAITDEKTARLFTPAFVDAKGDETTDVNKASSIKVAIDNEKAAVAKVELDKTYYLEVTYVSKDNKTLNKSVVPVKFTAPSLTELFSVREGYVVDGVINAYFYDTEATSTNKKAIDLTRYFREIPDGVAYSLDDKTTVVTDDGKNYATDKVLNAITNAKAVTLKSDKKEAGKSQFELGYGADLIINAKKDNYEGWKYAANSGDDTYTFKLTIKSPIVEGTISPIGSSSINIKANDLVNGARITGSQIAGYDYNGNQYSIVPDVAKGSKTEDVGKTQEGWHKNPQIKTVEIGKDDDNYIDNVTAYPAVSTKDGVANGYFVVKGRSLSNTQEVELPVTVTDAWGYTLKVPVSVTIQVGE